MDRSADIALSVPIVTGDTARNMKGEYLGQVEEVMNDLVSGRIRYAVVASDRCMGMDDRLNAIPWNPPTVELEQREIVVAGETDSLERTPGFDKDNWPRMVGRNWSGTIRRYYGSKSYLDATVPARAVLTFQ